VTCHSSVNSGTGYGLGDSVQFLAEAWFIICPTHPASINPGTEINFANRLTSVGSPLPLFHLKMETYPASKFYKFLSLWQFLNFSHSYDTSITFYENLVRGTQAVTWRERDSIADKIHLTSCCRRQKCLFLMMMLRLVDYVLWCIQTGLVYILNINIRHIRVRNL
jgi:hypothetical protein